MKTFGEALREVIHKRGLSVSGAAMELGFRSKTALFRILADECRISTAKRCMEAARESSLLALTPEEIAQLEQALEVSEIGKHTYAMNRVLRDMIMARPPEKCGGEIAVEGIDGVSTVRELLEHCAKLPRLSVTILGKCSADILLQLYEMARSMPMGGIRHILSEDARSIEDIEAFSKTAFMLFLPSYTLGVVRRNQMGDTNWVLNSRMIVISGDNGRGGRAVYQLADVGGRRYMGYKDESGALFEYWSRFGMLFKNSVDDLKGMSFGASDLPFPENYIRLCEDCMQIEAGREITMMKPDIPVMCVPPDVLSAAILEGIDGGSELVQKGMSRFAAIHAARHENFMNKKKPTNLVVEEEAMRRFALTGRRADHIFLARAFTPQERRVILGGLLEKTQSEPGLRLWFSKNSMGTDGRECAAYEGLGIVLVKPNTSWQLDGSHIELLLKSEFLAESIRNYMYTEVLRKGVLPQSDTVRILRELIELTRMGE